MPKHRRKSRKPLFDRGRPGGRLPLDPGETEGWWHAFGGEVPDMATDEKGNLGPAWQSAVFGPSAFGPDSPGPEPGACEPIREKTFPGHNGAPLTYLGSWMHYPSVEDIDAVTPEQYRASEGARTEPIPEAPDA
jgi:hypothetical protein